MRPHRVRLEEEVAIQLHAARRLDVELSPSTLEHPRVELVVPGRIEPVGEVDAAAVAADFDHLRPAIQRPTCGLLGCAARRTMPPSWIELTFFGLNGSDTSY